MKAIKVIRQGEIKVFYRGAMEVGRVERFSIDAFKSKKISDIPLLTNINVT